MSILDLSRAEGNILLPGQMINDAVSSAHDVAILPSREDYVRLRQKIADRHGVPVGSVVLCNGSDEAIEDVARMHRGGSAVTVVPCFERLYEVNEKYNIELSTHATTQENDFLVTPTDLVAIDALIHTKEPAVVWICNPCNPTGSYIETSDIRDLALRYPLVTFVIDETFVAMSENVTSCAGLVTTNPNIVTINSFSKSYGMSSCRVGFAIASPDVAELLTRAHTMFNVNGFGVRLATAALEWSGVKEEYVTARQHLEEIQSFVRINLSEKYILMNNAAVLNMFCIRHHSLSGQQLVERLLQYDIKVKSLDNMRGLEGAGYCRVLIPRSRGDMDTLFGALAKI